MSASNACSTSCDERPAGAVARRARSEAGPDAVAPYYAAGRLMKACLYEAESAAESARQEAHAARDEANRLRAAARAESAAIRREAAQQGRAESAEELAGILRAAREALDRLRLELTEAVVEGAFAVAEAVVGAELRTSPEKFIDWVRQVMHEARPYGRMTVVLHPEDMALAAALRDGLAGGIEEECVVEWRADEQAERHAVVVETDMGAFLGGLRARCDRLRAEVTRRGGRT